METTENTTFVVFFNITWNWCVGFFCKNIRLTEKQINVKVRKNVSFVNDWKIFCMFSFSTFKNLIDLVGDRLLLLLLVWNQVIRFQRKCFQFHVEKEIRCSSSNHFLCNKLDLLSVFFYYTKEFYAYQSQSQFPI